MQLPPRAVAALVLLPLLASGCAATIQDEQKERIRRTFDALPADVIGRLQAGELELHAYGPSATDGYGTRAVKLPEVSPGRGTQGPEIAGCRAAARALAATTARLYHSWGEDGGGQVWVEITEPLCERGRYGKELRIGVPQPGGDVLDTDAELDLTEVALTVWGFGEDSRGRPLQVRPLNLADVDEPLSADLPWDFRRDENTPGAQQKHFVVPAGTRLRAVTSCPGAGPAYVIRLDTGRDGPAVTFERLRDPEETVRSQDPGVVRCGQTRTVELPPVLSYPRTDGQRVDVVQLSVNDRMEEAAEGRGRVRVERVG